MKKLASILALASVAGLSQAAVSINSSFFTYTDTFTGFEGAADPANWTTSDAPGVASSTWQGTGTGSSNTGGKWSYGDSGSGASFDGSLGFLPSSTRAINADIEFVNDSGAPLIYLEISYVAEHWRSDNDGRNNGWAVSYSVNGGAFTSLDDLQYVAANTNPNGVNPNGGPWESVALSQTVTGISIPVDAVITVRFFGDNGTGGGARQGVAIDDFSFTAIPEPSTALFGLMAALGFAVRRRRA